MPHTAQAFQFLQSKIPEFRSRLQPKSLTYVGWRHDTHPWWHDVFCNFLGIETVTVVDIFEKNANDMRSRGKRYPFVKNVVIGDIRAPEEKMRSDIVFWDHGPEHVFLEELKKVTPVLFDKLASKMLLYACPWGRWPQGAEDNNPNEVHASYLLKEDLQSLGMDTFEFNKIDQPGNGELIAWKIK